MLYELINCAIDKNYKGLVRCIKSVFPAKWMSNIMFYKHHNRLIDYDNPTLFDEKLLILKDGKYKDNDIVTKCTDKYAVRKYITRKGQSSLLNGLIGVYKSVDEIEWEELPESFAVKCNHGCGYNIIVRDKKAVDKQQVYKNLRRWMKEDYSVVSAELHYHGIPRRIIIEEFIKTEDGKLPIDYKFFASRGKVICVLVYTGRADKMERIYVDANFRDLKLVEEYTGADYEKLKPESFDRMLEVASVLSEDFPFVRVDLYDEAGRVIFGELTFTPHGCCHNYLSEEAQLWIGEQIML